MLCLKCFYPPTRLYGVTTLTTIISGTVFLRIVLSNGWSNDWQSLSLQRFPFYFYSAAEVYSKLCCFFCASLSSFHLCEEADGGGESVSAVRNNGSSSLQ